MKTIEEKETMRMIKKYHVLIGQAGLDKEEKEMFLESLTGKKSSKDCTYVELMRVCSELEKMIKPKLKQLDYWRKRCLGACGKYVEMLGKDKNNINYIKAIICRAAKIERFNNIPINKLQALYNTFNYMARSMDGVVEETKETIEQRMSFFAWVIMG